MDYKKMWEQLQEDLEYELEGKKSYLQKSSQSTTEDRIRGARIHEIEKVLTLMSTIVYENR